MQNSAAFQFKSRPCSAHQGQGQGQGQAGSPPASASPGVLVCIFKCQLCLHRSRSSHGSWCATATHAAHIWLKYLLGSQQHTPSLRPGLCVLHLLPRIAMAVTGWEHLLSCGWPGLGQGQGCCPSFWKTKLSKAAVAQQGQISLETVLNLLEIVNIQKILESHLHKSFIYPVSWKTSSGVILDWESLGPGGVNQNVCSRMAWGVWAGRTRLLSFPDCPIRSLTPAPSGKVRDWTRNQSVYGKFLSWKSA